MKRINRKTFRLKQMVARCLIGCAVLLACHSLAVAGTLNFFSPYQWASTTNSGSTWTWTAATPGGVSVTATSSNGWVDGGSGGTDFTPPLTNEFNVFGNLASLTITLSGLNWGATGGELILGNVHDGYEYNLSATDTSGNPINVNAWTLLGEDLNSTDPTSECVGPIGLLPGGAPCAGGANSEDFYVYDNTNNQGSRQGGVVALGNLPQNLGTITLTLESDNVDNLFPSGGQGSDFIIVNVGPEAPEPSSAVLIGTGVVGMLALLRRRRRGSVA